MRKIVLVLLCIITLSGCGSKQNTENTAAEQPAQSAAPAASAAVSNAPRLDRIKNICRLSTLKCYYHNIAKSVKSPGTGAMHFGEKERVFWIEYTGIAEISYDAERIKMSQDGRNITVTLPRPDINCTVNPDSWTPESHVESEDNLANPNPITMQDCTQAINEAQAEMQAKTEQNTALINAAEQQAKELITNYIKQVGGVTGNEYTITWVNEDDIQTSEPEK
ncbi:MAG: DUF4230 domain-containing protein [Firmicutes bacterium]|nr:DUF4230 domain-containing protein [Bacillota bacterium]MBQ9604520.1 DUF4230 domain-containing protein [Bacillota bacterium]